MARPRYAIPRRICHHEPVDTVLLASIQAARLSKDALAGIMQQVNTSAGYLCQGVATEDQFVVFRTHMRIAQRIEHQGLTRGVLGHIDAVLCACSTIHDRAHATGTWHPTAITLEELDAIKSMVDLYEIQLHQVTHGEFTVIVDRLVASTLSTGGEVVYSNSSVLQEPSHA